MLALILLVLSIGPDATLWVSLGLFLIAFWGGLAWLAWVYIIAQNFGY